MMPKVLGVPDVRELAAIIIGSLLIFVALPPLLCVFFHIQNAFFQWLLLWLG
jgi:hypothetical protein